MKILVTYAVEGEAFPLKFAEVMRGEKVVVTSVCTGIGKVNAAFAVTQAIEQCRPDLVVNFGTVGTVKHCVGDLFLCRKFVDRDLEKVKGLGLSCTIDTSLALAEHHFCSHWQGEEGVCNTGDSFLTELTHVTGDVVDMEAFAQAYVCLKSGVPFIAVKYVTDVIGQNSVKHWEDKLADARQALADFFRDKEV